MKYTVLVNGERRTVDVPERMPLLWVLRDAMDLKGTKYGCGVAQCGACTVLLDGQPVRSCMTPISSIGTSAVTTIESLPRDASHPLQRAWLELDVPQCGYCQAGQLMSASALLKATPNPTDAADRRGDERQRLPLRHLHSDQAGHQVRRRAPEGGASHGRNPEGSENRPACVSAGLDGGRRRPAHRSLHAGRAGAGARRRSWRSRGVARAEHLHHDSTPTTPSRSSRRIRRPDRASRPRSR